MARRIQVGELRSSHLSEGCCFVYVLPSRYEDILKLGFSREPLERLRSLHCRFFSFFNLDRAWLIETETVRDARRLELRLAEHIALHNAPAPLIIRRAAAGHTEWYRGAHAVLATATDALRTEGFVVHAPATSWVRTRLLDTSDTLFGWSGAMLEGIEWAACVGAPSAAMERTLQDALDAYDALAINVRQLIPEAVWDWHRAKLDSDQG